MPLFRERRVVGHEPAQMFDLVADVESYPEFLPLCEDIVVRERGEERGVPLLVCHGPPGVVAAFTTRLANAPISIARRTFSSERSYASCSST